MRLDSILSLPTSLLFLISSYQSSADSTSDDQTLAQWQRSLEEAGHWPAAAVQKRRAVEEHLRSGRSPVGVVKMSPDEGEKFYMEYWQFEGDSAQSTIRDTPSAPLRTRDDDEEAILLANSSAVISFRPPFVLHTDHGPENDDLRVRGAIDSSAVLAMLEKRDFVCPTGTANCSSVGYMNSCCATDENCFVIQDTGLGPVGCCPKGTTCGGTISSCSSPNTPCAQDIGGGCCIPNYVCQGVGCVLNTTVTATIIQTPTTIASSSSPVSTSSTTLTMTSPITTSTTSSTPIPTTTSSSTATGVPPVRPTDVSSVTTTTAVDTLCPTAFYACSATYGGGCCRTGRDCDTTSCPTTSSTTIISSGVTVVVPVGSAATVNTPTGVCATGWSSCAASIGGNCCPSGFQCGTASCSSISATSTSLVQKASPNKGERNGVNGVFGIGPMLMIVMAFI